LIIANQCQTTRLVKGFHIDKLCLSPTTNTQLARAATQLVDVRENPTQTITSMVSSLAVHVHTNDARTAAAAQAAAVLRYLLCAPHDTWNKMHVEVVSTLVLALGSLLRSDNRELFAEAVRSCAWLHDCNPQTLHRCAACLARAPPKLSLIGIIGALLTLSWASRIASSTNIDRPVFGILITSLVTALKTWAPLSEPCRAEEALTDAGPVWEVLLYMAQNPSGRHHMLAKSAFDLTTSLGHVDEARSAEVDAARTLGLFLTEALHQAPTVRRAMSVLKALVADTADSTGCASQLLLLSYNAGLLLVSLSMALQVLAAEAAAEASGLNGAVGLYSAEKAVDCGRHAMLKLLGAGNQYKDLTRWVSNAHALSEAEGVAVQQILAGMVVVLHDAAALVAGAAEVVPPQDTATQREAATWALSVTLDALHHVAGVAPGHKLLGCVGSSLPQLLRGLAYVVTSTNLLHAMKALQLMLVLARAELGPLLLGEEALKATVTALSTRLVRLPVQDPNAEQLMLLATDCLHLCFDRPHGDQLLHMLFTGAQPEPSDGWGSWLGLTQTVAPARRRDVAQEYFLTGLAHALHLEDLSVSGKALELLVRTLHHPCGAGYRMFLHLPLDPVHTVCRISVLMQAWPYQTRYGVRTFADYKVRTLRPPGHE
jgi:xanthosine utilization system XapX-like protein